MLGLSPSITASTSPQVGDNSGALGPEAGEPAIANGESASVWYKWIAPANDRVNFSAASTQADPAGVAVRVYTGAAVECADAGCELDDERWRRCQRY